MLLLQMLSFAGGPTSKTSNSEQIVKKVDFAYLKDDKDNIYQKFGATKTPHVFILDNEMVVRYIGAIDDNVHEPEEVEVSYVTQAIAALEMGKSPDPATTKAVGCPIKSTGGKGKRGPGRKGPPSPDKILEMMVKNNDQKVSKEEVHGPLGRDFDRLDMDKDGMLTKAELENIKKRKK